jgi:hypothetical protein
LKFVVAGRGVSIQITTLKVLAGHPEGRASHADVTRSLAILMSSGADWSNRMKRLAARAPDLSIFSSGYVIRDKNGWQITDAGRAFLALVEAPASNSTFIESEVYQPTVAAVPDLASNVIRIADLAQWRRRRNARLMIFPPTQNQVASTTGYGTDQAREGPPQALKRFHYVIPRRQGSRPLIRCEGRRENPADEKRDN